MADIAAGTGFDQSILTPSYDDLIKKLGESTGQKLEMASQALQTAQMSHALLSKYKPYRDLTKTLSETIFDPVKAEFKQTAEKVASKVAGKFNPTGEGEGGISSKLIRMIGDNPEELLKVAKNPKALGKSLLNRAIDSTNLSAEEKAVAKAAAEGKISTKSAGKAARKLINDAIDKSDLPPEAKALGKTLSSGKVPGVEDAKNVFNNIIDNSTLSDEQKVLAKAAASGSRAKFIEQAQSSMSDAIDKTDIDPDVKTVIKNRIKGTSPELSAEGRQAMLDTLDESSLSPEAKALSKALVSGDKDVLRTTASGLLNDVLNKSDSPEAVKTLAKSVIQGRAPTAAEGKQALSSILPESVKSKLSEAEGLTSLPSEISAKAAQAAELPKLAKQTIENRIGKMKQDTVQELRNAGVSDAEIATNRDIDFQKIAREAPARFLDPSEITPDAPDMGLADAKKAFRESKYLESLKVNTEESGAARGDSTIARVLKGNLGKTATQAAESEAAAAAPEVKIGPYKTKTRAQIKEEARARKAGKPAPKPAPEEAGPTQQPVAEEQINANRELADPALKAFTERASVIPPKETAVSDIKPAEESAAPVPETKLPVAEEGITSSEIASGAGELAGGALGAFGFAQAIKQKDRPQEVIQGTQMGVQEGTEAIEGIGELASSSTEGAVTGEAAAAASKAGVSGATKAASELQKTTDESLAEDEDPVGAAVSGVLEIATLATMLAGIFAPKPKAPVVVGGYQSGV